MRFVPVKSAAQQAALQHHRVRDLLVRQRTMLINALRGRLGEFGIIAPAGRHRVVDLINLLQDAGDADVPALAREALRGLIAELHALESIGRRAQIDPLVLHRPPQALDEDVVVATTAPIHADLDPMIQQHPRERLTGELRPPIGIEDARLG
jgi:transposase